MTVANATPAQDDLSNVSIDAPIVASHNKYLEDQTVSIRARTIPWEGYQRASLITEDELAQIRQFEKSPSAALSEAGDKYSDLFLTLLQKLVRADTIQNILVLIDDVLSEKPERVQLFFRLAQQKNDPTLPYGPFFKLLKKDDEYIQLKSAKIATYLLLHAPSNETTDISELLTWLTTQMQNANVNIVDIAVQLLQSILSIPEYRLPFYQTHQGVQNMVDILKKGSPSAQMQYQVIYNLWLLTLIKDIAADLQRKYDVVPLLIDIVKAAIKEKVSRVVIATFKNLMSEAPQENMAALIGNKLLNVCENLSGRKWSDEDILEDLAYLKEELTRNVANLSTWDEYETEVRSGKLEWSPPHLSEQFWKQNANKLTERDFELLRLVSRIVATSQSPVVLAVAAHDIGQFVKYATNGKKALEEIGAKTQVMQLMTHADGDVRYQALMAVQKMMTHAYNA
ncbi:armadillo-type protein [Fimicolochytrium jonesii]|uniref:armadillo-type protein n=1 Tax=Fimicolochytrium jonesii TaxID=1396493 RepID=UPI0022FE27F8|nr:armadillo-type protein [Fimicolochytrium jonesii]KAI8821683.1 armadillo-type protein [Fimicolochytrium jonesii]